jgi:hypothetical protein
MEQFSVMGYFSPLGSWTRVEGCWFTDTYFIDVLHFSVMKFTQTYHFIDREINETRKDEEVTEKKE